MRRGTKELFVVGDRVLVRVEDGEERTNVGLYLPPTAIDNQAVQGGVIVATGPGLPMPAFDANTDEPWRNEHNKETRFIPMQARRGDFALFSAKPPLKSPLRVSAFSSFRSRRSSPSCATSWPNLEFRSGM